MIRSFRHKGLKLLFEKADRRKLPAAQAARIGRILAILDDAVDPAEVNLPGYRLHPLKGDRIGFWAVDVSGNWRITFRFESGHAYDVDLVDYH